MNCVIYCRVSSEDQVRGTSLSTQEAVCRQFAAREGWTVTTLYRDEGESAKTADRPQFQRMIREVCAKGAGVERVLVWKLDRFARNADDHTIFRLQLTKAGAMVISATESMEDDPAGRLLRTVLAGISQFDNECRAERTVTAMRQLAKAGYWVHKAPLGYSTVRVDGKPSLAVDPQAGPLVAHVFHAIASGTMTQARARDYLASSGYPVSGQTLHSMLRKTVYGGRIQSSLTGPVAVSAAFPALVTWETFQGAQIALSGRTPVALPDRRGSQDFPLAGVVACGDCEEPMRGYWARGRNQRYGYYDCRCGCAGMRRTRNDYHAEFEALLQDITRVCSPQLKLFRMRVTYHLRKLQGEVHVTNERSARRLEQLRAQGAKLLDKLLDATITDEVYKAKNAAIEAEIAIATSEARDAQIDTFDLDATCAKADQVLANLGILWRDAQGDGRRRFEAALFPHGLSYDRETGFRTALDTCVFSVLRQPEFEISTMAPPSGCRSNQLQVFRRSVDILAGLMVAA